MAAETSDHVLRRERLALRARIAQFADAGVDGAVRADTPRNPPVDIEIGGFAAVTAGDTLFISGSSSRPEARITALGAALAWFSRDTPDRCSRIVLFDAVHPGLTARRAAEVNLPITVLDARGTELLVAEPDPHLPIVQPTPEHVSVAELFSASGADVVVEHGVVSAEVVGLEVARVVDEGGVATPRIGVGQHDREMFQLVHGTVATVEQLQDVVRTVMSYRRQATLRHPISALAPERALRYRALSQPHRIGFATMEIAEPPVPRVNVKDSVPCCALGRTRDGADAVVVFTSGVDLDVVTFAADARTRLAPTAELLIATEARNLVPVQRRLAALLRLPARFIAA